MVISSKVQAIATLLNARRFARAGWSRFEDWGAAVAIERIFGDAIFSILNTLTLEEYKQADFLYSLACYQSAGGTYAADYLEAVHRARNSNPAADAA
jgi:hypothetical protein